MNGTKKLVEYLLLFSFLVFLFDVATAQQVEIIGRFGKYGHSKTGLIHNGVGFIGTGTSVDIYDMQNAASPVKISEISLHAPVTKIVVNDHYAYFYNGNYKDIYDIQYLESPKYLNSLREFSKSIVHNNNFVYVPVGGGIRILNASSPQNTYEMSAFDTVSSYSELEVSGNYLYALHSTRNERKVKILDISNPWQINDTGFSYTITSRNFSSGRNNIEVYENYLFLFQDYTIHIIDFTQPEIPRQLNTLQFGETFTDFRIFKNRLYVIIENAIMVYDVSDPSNVQLITTWQHTAPISSLSEGDRYVVVNETSGLNAYVFQYDEENNFEEMHTFSFDDISPSTSRGLQLKGNHAFIAQHDRLLTLDISNPHNPVQIAKAAMPDGSLRVSHVKGLTLAGNYAYAFFLGIYLAVFDISDPINTRITGTYDIGFPSRHGHGAVAIGDHLYVAGSGGFKIIDAGNKFEPVVAYESTQFGLSRDIGLYNGYIIYPSRATGLWILNIDDPINPTVQHHYPDLTSRNVVISGDYAYITTNVNSDFLIVDISEPTSPMLKGSIPIAGLSYDVIAYKDYVFIANALTSVIAIDVSDKNNPVIFDIVETGRDTREVYEHNGLIYALDYSAGLSVLSIDESALSTYTPSEENLDTEPEIFQLKPNFPNPFNPTTTINFRIDRESDAVLTIYNSTGQLVKKIVYTSLPKGEHYFNWDGTNDRNQSVSSGVYIYRLTVGNSTQSRKMLLIK